MCVCVGGGGGDKGGGLLLMVRLPIFCNSLIELCISD